MELTTITTRGLCVIRLTLSRSNRPCRYSVLRTMVPAAHQVSSCSGLRAIADASNQLQPCAHDRRCHRLLAAVVPCSCNIVINPANGSVRTPSARVSVASLPSSSTSVVSPLTDGAAPPRCALSLVPPHPSILCGGARSPLLRACRLSVPARVFVVARFNSRRCKASDLAGRLAPPRSHACSSSHAVSCCSLCIVYLRSDTPRSLCFTCMPSLVACLAPSQHSLHSPPNPLTCCLAAGRMYCSSIASSVLSAYYA